ncbi:MAG: biotin carboxyl carrier domain-containing protein [Chloroflexi bacterium]|nr:biotin carboxyl carrier domain-containing protein [Chloroflexota bacterium]
MSETFNWLEMVRRVVAEVSRSDATEFELSQGSFRLLVKRRPGARGASPSVETPPGQQQSETSLVQLVAAPLAGIFYRAPSPTAPPYVETGDWVESQTVVGLIETMKVFNEVTADVAGRVVAVLAQSGQLVRAGDPLLSVEPAEQPIGAPEVIR